MVSARLRKAARVVLPLYLGVIYATLGVIRIASNALRDAGMLRITVAAIFGLAVVALLAFLATQGLLKRLKVWVVLLLSAAVYGAVLRTMDSPEEKVHFVEYGIVGALAFAAAPDRLTGWKRYLAAAVFTLAAGWLDEGIQALLPSRYYDLRDVGFNAAAGVMALAVVAAFKKAIESGRHAS